MRPFFCFGIFTVFSVIKSRKGKVSYYMNNIGNVKKEHVVEFHQEQIQVSIKNLSKEFLYILEDLQQEHKFSDEKFKHYRKRILDRGGDASRIIERCLGYYTD